MKHISIIFLCLLFFGLFNKTHAVIGGKDAKEGEFPEVVTFFIKYNKGIGLCTASRISTKKIGPLAPKLLLTSAHCFRDTPQLNATNYQLQRPIILGNFTYTNAADPEDIESYKRTTAFVHIHPLYRSNYQYHSFARPFDIALIEIGDEAVEASFELSMEPLKENESITFIGFGSSPSNSKPFKRVGKSKYRAPDKDIDNGFWNFLHNFTADFSLLISTFYSPNGTIEEFPSGLKGGDSGAPLLNKDRKLVGVYSGQGLDGYLRNQFENRLNIQVEADLKQNHSVNLLLPANISFILDTVMSLHLEELELVSEDLDQE